MGYFYWGEANNPRRGTPTAAHGCGPTGRSGHPFSRWLNGRPEVGQGEGWTANQWLRAPRREVRIVELIATNRRRYLTERHVARYRDGGGQDPWVMEAAGQLYLVDGHHRVTAAYRRGETHIYARVIRVRADEHAPTTTRRRTR